MQWIIWTIGSYKFKHFAYLSPFLHTQAQKNGSHHMESIFLYSFIIQFT